VPKAKGSEFIFCAISCRYGFPEACTCIALKIAALRGAINFGGYIMEERAVGIVAIIVKERENSAQKVNEILADFGDMVVGRMGLPYHERNLNIITLIVDASNDRIGALTGRLGQIPGITVKSTLAKM